MPQGALTGAACAHRGVVDQGQVDDPSFASVQWVHRLGLPGFFHSGGEPTGDIDQFPPPPIPISLGVENDPGRTLVFVADDTIDEILERIERLAMPADEQPSGVTRDAQANLSRMRPRR